MILGIYGAGGLGREVLELATIINSQTNKWDDIENVSVPDDAFLAVLSSDEDVNN